MNAIFPRISIRLAIIGMLILLIGSVSVVSIAGILQFRQNLSVKLNDIEEAQKQLSLISNANANLKLQLLNWKKFLLRATTEQSYFEHLSNFYDIERKTLISALELSTQLKENSNEHLILQEFLESHRELGIQYRNALRKFNSTNIDPHVTAELTIEDNDQRPVKLIEELQRLIENRLHLIRKQNDQEVEKSLIIGAFAIAGFSILAIFIVYILINKRLVMPLKSVVTIADQISKGNLDSEINSQRHDELGELFYSLNTMRLSLAQAQKDAQQFTEDLEHKVWEKTEELSRSEKLYRSLFDNADIAILNADFSQVYEFVENNQDNLTANFNEFIQTKTDELTVLAQTMKIRTINDATVSLFDGMSKSHVYENLEHLMMPNALDFLKKLMQAIILNEPTVRLEAPFKSLSERTLHTIVSCKLSKVDGITSVVPVSIIDVTEQRALEDQIRRTQKLEAIGQLTGGIAHDFNNILGIIQGNAELLEEKLSQHEKEHVEFKNIFRGLDRATDITSKLLTFSRKQTHKSAILNINTTITDLQTLVAKSLTAAITVETNLSEDLWLVNVDQGDFEDAILNLAINARDAMSAGGHLIIETQNKIIDTAFKKKNIHAQPGEYVMISISDTGEGMAEDIKQKIFEPFFTTKDQGKGTGLGLSMVYGFITRTGGFIDIYSVPGKGTTFRLFLPRSQALATDQPKEIEDNEALPVGNETILIVDDEIMLSEIAQSILRKLGYKTLISSNGEAALQVLEQNHASIDLLFSDIVMPGKVDGFTLADTVSRNWPGVKVLLTSGFAKSAEQKQDMNNMQITNMKKNLLDKPYNKIELAKAIRSTLDAG